jgi:glycosyltransferase involved in cell wall biosynthesis
MKNIVGSATVFYHFYKPDDVVSAVHFSDLCEGLVDKGWSIAMLTSNRYCRQSGHISPKFESIAGVSVHRHWRPAFSQSNNILRMINSIWIQLAWLWTVARSDKPDFFIVGTDPQFSQFMLPALRKLSPKTKIVFWCFDLFPEAILADSDTGLSVTIAKGMYRFMPRCYKAIDIMVDIGSCMRELLRKHGHSATEVTLVPWALSEPSKETEVNTGVRASMFGENCQLGVLYSGSLGMAHEYQSFLALARSLRIVAPNIVFAFSARGNRMDELRQAINNSDTNVRILPFASQDELEDRLNAADVHLLSLREKWAGIVVPSKFFGSIAAGKPVIYAGAPTSCVDTLIRSHKLGLVIDKDDIASTAEWLIHISQSPVELREIKSNAYAIYHAYFSRSTVLDGWHKTLLAHRKSMTA